MHAPLEHTEPVQLLRHAGFTSAQLAYMFKYTLENDLVPLNRRASLIKMLFGSAPYEFMTNALMVPFQSHLHLPVYVDDAGLQYFPAVPMAMTQAGMRDALTASESQYWFFSIHPGLSMVRNQPHVDTGYDPHVPLVGSDIVLMPSVDTLRRRQKVVSLGSQNTTPLHVVAHVAALGPVHRASGFVVFEDPLPIYRSQPYFDIGELYIEAVSTAIKWLNLKNS